MTAQQFSRRELADAFAKFEETGRRQEDIYNPLRFLRAGVKWCRRAHELGTLDEDAARWMQEYGGAQ